MTDTMDWDDVRVFLAAMRASSLRQAADGLKVSYPTARRRLNALEAHLGLKLFDRRTDGLHATTEAAGLYDVALEVERAMLALGRVAQAADPELRGPIRVTLPDMIASDLLMPDLVAFSRRWPQIELQLEATDGVVDLSRREADVAVRFMPHGKLPSGELVGRHAATMYSAAYGTGDCWVGWYGDDRDASWIAGSPFPDLPARGGMNNALLQRAACAAGMGLAWLPCYFADPSLPRRSEPEASFDAWVLLHPDLRRSPRLRVFRDAVVHALRHAQPRLEGRLAG